MPTNDGLVLAPSQHRLDKAELPKRPRQRLKLFIADFARVCRVQPQEVDCNLLDFGLCKTWYEHPQPPHKTKTGPS